MATVRLMADKRAKVDGSVSISLVIRIDKTRYVFNTGISAPSMNCFNETTLLGKTVPQFKVKNVRLTALKNSAEKLIIDEESKLMAMPAEKAKTIISEKVFGEAPKKVMKFIDYLDEFVSLKKNVGTKSVYATTRNKIVEFDESCTFDTMDRRWLTNFEGWMVDCGLKVNAYAIHLRNIRSVFNYAIDEEITTLYPFRKFKIKKEETAKRSLTAEEIALLRDYDCEEHQERYRDMFMLMLYLIGINAVDLFNLKQIIKGRIEYNRAKTNKLYSIKVEPEAMAVIEKYRGQDWLLNILDDYGNYKDFLHRMGIGLKQIGPVTRSGLGGKKDRKPLFPDISSYWARHTWATIAAELDIPKETISEALGHEIGSAVTSIYIKFDRKKVDEANRKVIDYLNSIKVDI